MGAKKLQEEGNIDFFPISYWGSKASIAKEILPYIPKHKHYLEPFAGSSALYWLKKPSRLETLNDKLGITVNLYSVFANKRAFFKLCEMLYNTPYCEHQFKKATKLIQEYNHKNYNPYKPNVEMAYYYWYAIATSFSRTGGSLSVGNTYKHKQAISYYNKKAKLLLNREQILNRLHGTVILNKDALEVIRRFDGKDAFFYVDPPYPNASHCYYTKYTMDEYKELLALLAKIKGKFLLSTYAEENLQKAIKENRWYLKDIHMKLLASSRVPLQKAKDKTEYLISNYPL